MTNIQCFLVFRHQEAFSSSIRRPTSGAPSGLVALFTHIVWLLFVGPRVSPTGTIASFWAKRTSLSLCTALMSHGLGWAHTTASSYLNSGKPYLWVSEIVRLLFSQLDKTLALFSIVDVQHSNQRCPFRSCWISGGGTIAAGGSAPKGRSSWNRYSSVENERLRLIFLMEGSIPREYNAI